MARVIGIVSGKGGVGKTVVAINLAAALHKLYRKKVLLVDGNVTSSHAGLYLGLYSTPTTLNHILKGNDDVRKAIYQHTSGIDVLPASIKLEDLKGVDWQTVKEKLSPVLNDYDFVIIDSSPGFTREALITLGSCNEMIMVTNPIVHYMADLIKCKELARELNVKSLGVVVNMVRNKNYELTSREINQLVDTVISSIPYDEKVIESVIFRTPVVHTNAKAKKHFHGLAQYVMGDEYSERSFFSRIARLFRLS